jgi:circadian clock protein KaiC
MDVAITALIDTWLLVRDIELGGERTRGMYILKSRGMRHSNQVREFVITASGIDLLDVYVGPQGVLTGSARDHQAARDAAERQATLLSLRAREASLLHRRQGVEAQIAVLQAELAGEEEAVARAMRDMTAGTVANGVPADTTSVG